MSFKKYLKEKVLSKDNLTEWNEGLYADEQKFVWNILKEEYGWDIDFVKVQDVNEEDGEITFSFKADGVVMNSDGEILY